MLRQLTEPALRTLLATCVSCNTVCRGAPRYGTGKVNPELMLVGQNPPIDPVRGLHGAYLMHYKDESIRGPHEQLVHQLIQRLGLTPAQVYATQAVKCQTPNNDTPSMEVVIRCASKFLNREIAEMNPRVILAFGDLAWRAVADRFRLDAEDECFKILPVGGSTDFDARRNGMLIKAPHPSTVVRFVQKDSWIENICEQYVKARAYTRPLTIRETVIQRWENHND